MNNDKQNHKEKNKNITNVCLFIFEVVKIISKLLSFKFQFMTKIIKFNIFNFSLPEIKINIKNIYN